jgi:hypothetical protein
MDLTARDLAIRIETIAAPLEAIADPATLATALEGELSSAVAGQRPPIAVPKLATAIAGHLNKAVKR